MNFTFLSLVSQRKSHHIDVMVENNVNKIVITDKNSQKTKIRLCDWPDCGSEGKHRAPKSPDNIREYSWFCLQHVRIYNSSWNYYEGISHEEFNSLVRSDITWNRPTWPLGKHQRGAFTKNEYNFGTHHISLDYENSSDPFDFFGKNTAFKKPTKQDPRDRLSVREKKALSLLGFDVLVKVTELKARYKSLVKKYHPDSTGGNKKLEERFKQINEAYEIVKTKLTSN